MPAAFRSFLGGALSVLDYLEGANNPMKSPGLAAVLAFLVFLFVACDSVNKLRATKIKDIIDHPREYENKEITIYGTVTGAASLLFFKFFEVQDDTGSIKVLTSRVLPKSSGSPAM
jgi:hypothetical protein